jgi:hypothetical protein
VNMQTVDPEVEAERLRHVRALVEDVLRDADVCAQVIIAGRAGRFENFTHLEPKWCNLALEHDPARGDGVRLRSKNADYPNAKTQAQHLGWSVGVAGGFAQIGGLNAMLWLEAATQFDKATGATHTPMERIDPRDPK